MKYLVIGLVDAVVNIDVEATTPDEALEKAQSEAHASVCHQCSDELEVSGDFVGWRVVEDGGEGETVYDDTGPSMATRPMDLDQIQARADAYASRCVRNLSITNAGRAAHDREVLLDWLRRSGVLGAR